MGSHVMPTTRRAGVQSRTVVEGVLSVVLGLPMSTSSFCDTESMGAIHFLEDRDFVSPTMSPTESSVNDSSVVLRPS